MFYFEKNGTIADGQINENQGTKSQINDGVLKPLLPINVIAKISENYTANYIENKYYNNHIESWSSITFTLFVLTVIAVMVLACSVLCLKKLQKLVFL